MSPSELFLSSLDTIERAARFVARRGGLSPQDADDLIATVKLALIENDYAVLRGFEGRCSIGTYVASIAHRLLADERMHVSGRWRPSAESKRAGEGAMLLEKLVVRDRRPLEEALVLVRKVDASMTRESAEALLARLPARAQRAQLVALDDHVREQEVGPETVEAGALARDSTAAMGKTNAVLAGALATLPPDDRVLILLRFGHGMRVAAIARAWQCDQQILYRRIDVVVRTLRRHLMAAGIDAITAAQLIGGENAHLDFGWTDSEKLRAIQTIPSRDSGSEDSQV